MIVKEIQIPVPWGIIAAKTWGNEKLPLILAVHGMGDNANSFDTLIPMLTDAYYYVCVDLPSHGKSSHLQSLLVLHESDYVVVLKLIYDYLQRDKITLLAHSMGAFASLHFTQFYPQCVQKVIVFDIFFYFPKSCVNYYETYQQVLVAQNKILKLNPNQQPTYTKEQIIDKFMKRMTPMSRKSVEIIAERSMIPAENGKYKITSAQHVKALLPYFITRQDLVSVIKRYPIKCPHLLVASSNSSFMKIAYKGVHEEFKKNINYEFHIVEGNHDVHLEHPERVAPIVNKFLLKHSNKL